ncbi:hypothetical protein CJ260_00995 [Megasphaera sp. ASD88]|uniref:protein-export chaperone SecB n=1 Tax=Megasphaera sp. ASD88 TaxID=2027407 RepID=UPI000BAB3DA4|nr:protein-export chaperone SecB [Megasphaera sp. ASD88]PAV40045.1 hypothetical protein CJ260_00995 [Megasphaera sp. ASD88]
MEESHVQFKQPMLEECCFSVNKGFFKADKKNTSKSQKIKLPLKTEINVGEIIDNKSFVSLLVEVGEKNNNTPFYARTKMSSLFVLGEGLSEDECESFLKINAPALLLSYTRPIIASLVNDAALPKYNIPFINFTK